MKKFYGGHSRLFVAVDNARITANTVGQCAKLVNVAKKLSDSAPADVKAGPFHVRGCGMKNVLIGTGIMIGVALVWKSIGRKRGNDGEIVAHTLPEPEPSKMESLNETIGKNNDSLKEMRVVGDLIRYGGINMIFSPTGEGKSVLAMQLAIDIAGGKGSLILPEEERQAGRPVFTIVYDEEQDENDITERYGQTDMQYPEKLQRIESCMFDNETQLLNDIKQHVSGVNEDVCVIIDNITSIIPSMSTNRVRHFYKHLKQIQKEKKDCGFRVTFIIVAHTIKDYSSPISLRDLAGNANNSNFLNRVIALLPTRLGEDVKVLKILKSRDTLKGDGIVIRMLNEPYIHFEYESTAELKDAMSAEMLAEVNRLLNDEGGECRERSPQNPPVLSKEQRKAAILKWHESGMTQKKMSQKLGVSETSIGRYIEEMREEGLIKAKPIKGNNEKGGS